MTMNNTRRAVKGGKDLLLILVLTLAFTVAGPVGELALRKRFVRDLLGVTPFHNVQIYTVRVGGEGFSVTITGAMQKRGCERLGVNAYTAHQGGPLHPATFDPSGEHPDTPINRPPSNNLQVFGPWTITSEIAAPDFAYFYVTHACPQKEGGKRQTNRFFKVRFEDYTLDRD